MIHHSKDDNELRHLVSNFRQMAASTMIYGAPKGVKIGFLEKWPAARDNSTFAKYFYGKMIVTLKETK